MSNISSIFKEKSKFMLSFCCSCILATKENVAENDANKTKLEERNVEIHRNLVTIQIHTNNKNNYNLLWIQFKGEYTLLKKRKCRRSG